VLEDELPDASEGGAFSSYESFGDVQLTAVRVGFDVDDVRF
jgi:hypothetical protein